MDSCHMSVMKEECLSFVKGCGARRLVDCNLGEGGHSRYFLERMPDLFVTGVDCDPDIMKRAERNLADFQGRVRFANAWSDSFLAGLPDASEDCVFFDLGVSMYHFKEAGRGFSFSADEPLDMRLRPSDPLTAWDVVNLYDEKRLADLIYAHSDERNSRRIARRIVEERRKAKISDSKRLAEIVRAACGNLGRASRLGRAGIDPATRTFQAIRIEVNGEIERLERGLSQALRVIRENGVVMAISFHSLEDRVVKRAFRAAAADGKYALLTRKPIVAGKEEADSNPPSRSAKLRVIGRME